ncbi:MAG: class I SAM-dependent RNA methyltransferase [Elusimicrobia bacterium]|nr:class I SAM-dependent RNA methyltransferase [Elusimicrobiota bacterium]
MTADGLPPIANTAACRHPPQRCGHRPGPQSGPACRHFGTCGGCASQDIEYNLQAEAKKNRFKSLVRPLGIDQVEFTPAPDPWYYRNKIELSFAAPLLSIRHGNEFAIGFNDPLTLPSPSRGEGWGEGGNPLILGFKHKGKWFKVFDLEECRIFDERLGAVVGAIRSWAKQENLSPYNPKRQQGFLRYLVIRRAMNGSLLIMPVTTSSQQLPKNSLLATLNNILLCAPPIPSAPPPLCHSAALPHRLSLLWGIQDLASDTAQTQRFEIISGEPYLFEELLGRRFRYSINSFFQTNPRAFELLLKDIVDQASLIFPNSQTLKLSNAQAVLDLYCGVGTIGITLAERFGVNVLGIESAESSIEDARFNVGHGDTETRGYGDEKTEISASPRRRVAVSFLCARVEKVLPEMLQKEEFREGLVILDPPRSGLHPKVLKVLEEKPPKNLFYVSCNPPLTAQKELPRLSQIYKIVCAKAYDFFPQTEHFEAFFTLERKEKERVNVERPEP